MATSRKDIQERFHRAALDAYASHGFKSYRQAEQATGVNYSTIYVIVSRGRLPSRGQVIEWAEGLREPVNKWLDLAGYDPIEPGLVADQPEDPEEKIRLALRAYPELSEQDVEAVMASFQRILDRKREQRQKS